MFEICLVYELVYGFFGMQMVYIYTEIYGANVICFGIRPEMTVFGWYTTGIWRPGICIMTFICCCDELSEGH